mmetsp:Transcript_8928/g.16248  ORF Transcript_8928/g.16248 Transcript_8928/m.16248 type:complete len:564 (-) Transcript_8928:184-1875(-)
MGQCHLPTDTRNSANTPGASDPLSSGAAANQKYDNMRFSPQAPGAGDWRRPHQQQDRDDFDHQERRGDDDQEMVDIDPNSQMNEFRANVARQSNNTFEPFMNQQPGSTRSHQNGMPPSSPRRSASPRSPRERDGQNRGFDSPPPQKSIPLPPESAVRTRCYRLNLNTANLSGGGDLSASFNPGLSETVAQSAPAGPHLGPLVYDPSEHLGSSKNTWPGGMMLQMSKSEESTRADPTQVAIGTAQIFRGITVSADGTTVSKNPRANRSKSGKDSKQGEKSRQAAKIDKANDLVDETLDGGEGKEDDSVNMVSLVIVGEYDDMKHLVRDGSKKLRDAEGMPDEALLSINRPRMHSRQISRSGSGGGSGRFNINTDYGSPTTSPSGRKRQPNANYSGHNQAPYSPVTSTRNKMSSSVPNSAPPKLKGHPRDRPSTRRLGGDGDRRPSRRFPIQDQCQSIPMFGGGDNHWVGAQFLNSIWNCGGTGGTGTMSGNHASPTYHNQPHSNNNPGGGGGSRGGYEEQRNNEAYYPRAGFDGRDTASYRRAGGTSERVEAPGRNGENDVVLV